MKKIKIKVNGKVKTVLNNSRLSDLLNNLNIPIKKVAIELNQEIIDKKRTSNIKLKKSDISITKRPNKLFIKFRTY